MGGAVKLAAKLKEHGVGAKAVEEYKSDMFPYVVDVITRSAASGHMFFARDGSREFLDVMNSTLLIRNTYGY